MGGGTVISDADAMLDGIRTLLFNVWRAFNKRGSIPGPDLDDCFRSFGLEGPLCELHQKQPDLGIVIKGLEYIESSLMGVSPW